MNPVVAKGPIDATGGHPTEIDHTNEPKLARARHVDRASASVGQPTGQPSLAALAKNSAKRAKRPSWANCRQAQATRPHPPGHPRTGSISLCKARLPNLRCQTLLSVYKLGGDDLPT